MNITRFMSIWWTSAGFRALNGLIGLLTLALIHYFTASSKGEEAVMDVAAQVVHGVARQFPVQVICASRWPVFEVVEVYQRPLEAPKACEELRGEVDWRHLRLLAEDWASLDFEASRCLPGEGG